MTMIEQTHRPVCLLCEDKVAAGELIRLDRIAGDAPPRIGPVPVACESCAFHKVDHSSGRWGFSLYPENDDQSTQPKRKRKS